jgi:hypothetical protein
MTFAEADVIASVQLDDAESRQAFDDRVVV